MPVFPNVMQIDAFEIELDSETLKKIDEVHCDIPDPTIY